MKDGCREGLHFLENNRNFIGREFLTWLLYSIGQGYSFDAGFKLEIDSKVKLVRSSGSISEVTIKGGNIPHSNQLKQSLRDGSMVSSMRVVTWNEEKGLFSWNMDAETLWPKSLKVPPVQAAEAEDLRTGRIELLNLVTDYIDNLFAKYMDIRQNQEDFVSFISAYREWIWREDL